MLQVLQQMPTIFGRIRSGLSTGSISVFGSTDKNWPLVGEGIGMWNEVLPHMFSSRGQTHSLNIIVNSCLAGVVLLTEYYQSSNPPAFIEVVLVFLSVCLMPKVSRAALL